MSRLSRKLVRTLLAGLLTAVPASALAQLDARAILRAQQRGEQTNLYGNNPYETQDEEGAEQPQDTTKKKKRIRKPLESYFFSDSVRALNNFKWHIDPDYFRRPQFFDFSFASPYYAYIYDMRSVPFYNTKRPLIRMGYIESGQKRYREENFNIMLAQNVSPSTGFNVDYKARGTRGLYAWSRTKNHNLSVAFSHTGKRYSVHAAYYNNHIEQQENGGVAGIWAIADTTFQHPSGVPMKLADAEARNIYRNNAFFLTQSYGIPLQRMTESDFSMAGLSAVYIGHSFQYSSWSKVYTDRRADYVNDRDHRDEEGNFVSATGSYYDDWFINPAQSRDSLYERVIAYLQCAMDDYLTGKYRRVKKTSYFAYGSVGGKIKKYVDWDANLRFYPSGYRGGDLEIGAHLALTGFIRRHPLILEGRFSMNRRTPSYWHENLFSNHYRWSAPLDKENETRFEVRFAVPDFAFEAGLQQGVVGNKVYYGADSRIAQHDGTVSLTSVYARMVFRFGGFHLDNRVLLQWSTNQEVVPVPLLGAYLSYYYEFWVVRDVLRLQIGLAGRYPLSAFYNQREVEVGNYPYVDAFAMAKWKRMRIFLKYQHVNRGLFGNGEYFSVANYPLNPGMFKIGISWGFYD